MILITNRKTNKRVLLRIQKIETIDNLYVENVTF